MNYQNDVFFQFLLDEYHYDSDYGSVIDDHHRGLKALVADSTFKTHVTTDDVLGLMSREMYEGIESLVNTRIFTDKLEFEQSPANLAERLTELMILLSQEKVTILPFSRSRHAVVLVFVESGTSYNIYFCNSGLGSEHQIYKSNQRISVDSIIMQTVTKDVLRYFLAFTMLSNTLDDFYKTALNIAQQNSIYVDSADYIEAKGAYMLKNKLNSDLSFLETQQVGSCSYRSIMIPVYMYLCILGTFSVERFDEWIGYARIFMTKKYLMHTIITENLERILSNQNENTFFHYVVDVFTDRERYTDNQLVKKEIREINALISQIKTKLMEYKKEVDIYATLEDSDMFMNVNLDDAAPLRLNMHDKKILNQCNIYEYLDRTNYPNQIVRRFDSFNTLLTTIKDNQIDWWFDELSHNVQTDPYLLDTFFTTHRMTVASDVLNLVNEIRKNIKIPSADELFTNIKKNRYTLDCNFMLLFGIVNTYCKKIAEDLKLPEMNDYKMLNRIMGPMVISNALCYDKFKKTVEKILGNDKLYIEYLTTGSEQFTKALFPGDLKVLSDKANKHFDIKSCIMDYEKKLLTGVYIDEKHRSYMMKKIAVYIFESILEINLADVYGSGKEKMYGFTIRYTIQNWLTIHTNYSEKSLSDAVSHAKRRKESDNAETLERMLKFMRIDLDKLLTTAYDRFISQADIMKEDMIDDNGFSFKFNEGYAERSSRNRYCNVSIYNPVTKNEIVYNGYGSATNLTTLKQFHKTCAEYYGSDHYVPVGIKQTFIPRYNYDTNRGCTAPSMFTPEHVGGGWRDHKDNKFPLIGNQQSINLLYVINGLEQGEKDFASQYFLGYFDRMYRKIPTAWKRETVTDEMVDTFLSKLNLNRALDDPFHVLAIKSKIADPAIINKGCEMMNAAFVEMVKTIVNKTYDPKNINSVQIRNRTIELIQNLISEKYVKDEPIENVSTTHVPDVIPEPLPKRDTPMKEYLDGFMLSIVEPMTQGSTGDNDPVKVVDSLIDIVVSGLGEMLKQYTQKENLTMEYDLGNGVKNTKDNAGKFRSELQQEMIHNRGKLEKAFRDVSDKFNEIVERSKDILSKHILRHCYANTFYVTFSQSVRPFMEVKSLLERILYSRNKLITDSSTQYVLPSLCRDIIINPYGELKNIINTANIFPNVYMLQNPDITKESISRTVGLEYDYHNHRDNFTLMFNEEIDSEDLNNFAATIKSWKLTQNILDIEKKFYVVMCWLFYKINMLKYDALIDAPEDKSYHKLLTSIVTYSKQKEYEASMTMSQYMIDYLDFKKNIAAKTFQNMNQIVGKLISYDLTDFIKGENDTLIIEEGIIYDLLAANTISGNKFEKELLDYYGSTVYLRDFATDTVVARLINKFNFNRNAKSKVVGGKAIFTSGDQNISILHRNRISENIKYAADFFTFYGSNNISALNLQKIYDVDTFTKYVVLLNGERVLVPYEIESIPLCLVENSIITLDSEMQPKILRYDTGDKLRDNLLITESASNMSVSIETIEKSPMTMNLGIKLGKTVYEIVPDTAKLYQIITDLLHINHMDLPDGILILKNTSDYYLFFPRLNLRIKITHDTMDAAQVYGSALTTELDQKIGMKVLNCSSGSRYLLGSQRNILLCGSGEPDRVVMFHSSLTQGDKPLRLTKCAKPNNSMWKYLPDKITMYQSTVPDSYSRVHSLTHNLDRMTMIVPKLIADGPIMDPHILFDSQDSVLTAFRLYHSAIGYSNYPVAKMGFGFLTKVGTMSHAVQYVDYLSGVFPFNKMWILTNELLKKPTDTTYQMIGLIILNKKIPTPIRFKKGFFNRINTDNMDFRMVRTGIPFVGPCAVEKGTHNLDMVKTVLYDLRKERSQQIKHPEINLRKFLDDPDALNSILLNYLCRIVDRKIVGEKYEVVFDEESISAHQMNDYVFGGFSHRVGAHQPETKLEEQFNMTYQVTDVGRELKWDVMMFKKTDGIMEFLVDVKRKFKGVVPKTLGSENAELLGSLKKANFANEHIDNQLDEMVLEFSNREQETVQETTHEPVIPINSSDQTDLQIYRYCDNFMSGTETHQITDLSAFREDCSKYLNGLIRKIEKHVADQYKKQVIDLSQIIDNLDNVEMAEIVFFNTLLIKYKADLLRLTSPKYDVLANIDLFMQMLREYPGYIDDDGHIEVNTLIVYFDYVFSMTEGTKEPLKGGTVIRKKQYKLINRIIDSDCNVSARNKFHQMIMGAGKSTYIAPLLSLLMISGGLFPIHCMPEYLIEQSVERMSLLQYFGITNVRHQIGRQDMKSDIYCFDEISLGGINNQAVNLIMSDQSLKAILLNNTQYGDMTVIKKMLTKLRSSYLIFDEVDDISDPYSCELNYPDPHSTLDVEMLENRFQLHSSILKYFYCMEIRKTQKIPVFAYESIKYDPEMKEPTLIYIDRELTKSMTRELYGARSKEFTKEINQFLGLDPKNELDAKLIIDFTDQQNIDALVNYVDFIKMVTSFMIKIDDFQDLTREYGGLKQNFVKKFELIRSLFHDVIPFCLVTRNRKDFGLIDTKGYLRDHKGHTIAIPFKALEDPNFKSEFSSIDITIALTVVSYMSNPWILRTGDYDMLFDDLLMAYRQMDDQEWTISDTKAEYIETCNSILRFEAPADIDITILHSFADLIKYRDTFKGDKVPVDMNTNIKLFDNMIQTSAKKYMKEYTYQLSSTFSDVSSSDFCPNRTGFSGTPYFIAPLDRNSKKILDTEPQKDEFAEGQIYYSILDKRVEVIPMAREAVQVNDNRILSPIETVMLLLENKKYYALIDIGAYFLGMTSEQVAEMILGLDHVHHVLYLDKDDRQVIVSKADQNFTPRMEKDVQIKDGEKLFVYYDQKHITGIDVKKMHLQAKGLVLLRYTNQLRDYSQGAFRLRKINITQSVDIVVDRTIIKKANMMPSDSQDIWKHKLLKHLIRGQNNLTIQKEQMQSLHNIRTICRYAFLNRDVSRLEYSLMNDDMRRNVFMIRNSYGLPKKIEDIVQDPVQYVIRSLNGLVKQIVELDNNIRLKQSVLKLEKVVRQIIVSRRMDSQQVNMNIAEEVAEEMEEEQIEEEDEEIFQQMMMQLRKLYNGFTDVNQSYPIDDILDLNSVEVISEPSAFKKTFVSYGYDDVILISSLFISRFYAMTYEFLMNNRMEFQYRLIWHNKFNKLIVCLPEEFLQIRNIYERLTLKDESVRGLLDLNVKCKALEKGMISLLRYQLDFVLNMRNDQIAMIDRYITDVPLFKTYSYVYTRADDLRAKKQFKIVDRTILKIILGKQFSPVKMDIPGTTALLKHIKMVMKINGTNERIEYIMKQNEHIANFLRILFVERFNIANYISMNLKDITVREISWKYVQIYDLMLDSYLRYI